MRILGLIPARAGSKRISGKNLARLYGKTLLQIAIETAIQSNTFSKIVVSSDWSDCLYLAGRLGVDALERPVEISGDKSHDYEWVAHALERYDLFDAFAILRPTSPFRTASTIRRAFSTFLGKKCDSLRAVSLAASHPLKSWLIHGAYLEPYQETILNGFPSYDLGTQMLGDVYAQNGCIQFAWGDVPAKFGNVSGKKILAFKTEGWEGFDINTYADLKFAEAIVKGEIE